MSDVFRIGLRLGISFLLILVLATQCDSLSSFHQDIAFSYLDTNGTTTFPINSYDDPPLLDRKGTGARFRALIAGVYVFTFHAGKNGVGVTEPTNYKLGKTSGLSVEVLLRLTTNGPAFGHNLVELEEADTVEIGTYRNGTTSIVTPTANTTNPVIFNGFNLYHRCLCSPLVLRQSAFSAARTIDVGLGNIQIGFTASDEKLDIHDEFDVSAATGVFTASLPGIYVFMYSFPNSGVGTVKVSLTVNNRVRSTVSSISASDRVTEYAGTTVVLDLVGGDRVRLVKDGGPITILSVTDAGTVESASPILFSGFLL